MRKRFKIFLSVVALLAVFAGKASADLTWQYSSSLTLQNGSTVYLTVDANGNVVHGQGAALAQNFTNGACYIPTCLTGAPSGTPTSFTGSAAMVVGGDNNLYYYAGGAWKLSSSGASTPALGAVVNVGNTVNSVSATATIQWTTGGGGVTQIQGPTDQTMFIGAGSSGAGVAGQQCAIFGGNGNGAATASAQVSAGGQSATGQGGACSFVGGASSGTNTSAINCQFSAGRATGLGTPASIVFQTTGIRSASGTTLQTLSAATTISGAFNNTSGSTAYFAINPTWADQGVTSTTVALTLALTPTHNYTAASKTGNTEVLFINPTETATPSPTAPTANNLIHAQDGGTERFSVTTGGQCGVNMQPLAPANANSAYNDFTLNLPTASSGDGVGIFMNTNDSGRPNISFFKNRATNFTTSTAISSGDGLGQLFFYGAAGGSGATFYGQSASITAFADGAFSTTSNPGRLVFGTTAVNATAATGRLCLDSGNNWRAVAGLTSGWVSSTTDASAGSLDTGFSRVGAASVALGNGTNGNGSGGLTLTNISSPAATNLNLERGGANIVISLVGIATSNAATSLYQTTLVNGATYTVGVLHNSVTTSSGTSVDLATAVPAGSSILGVTYRITTTVTGPTANLQLQDSGGNVYLTQTALTAGTTIVGGPFGGAPGAFFNNFYSSANTFKLVSTATAFTAGVIEVEIVYATMVAPTS